MFIPDNLFELAILVIAVYVAFIAVSVKAIIDGKFVAGFGMLGVLIGLGVACCYISCRICSHDDNEPLKTLKSASNPNPNKLNPN
jgi:hypothetical protein